MKHTEMNAIVLDFLRNGYSFEDRRIPIAQVVGDSHFTLLEVIPKKDITLIPGERVYIGEERRDKIHHVRGRINYSKLTSTAKDELLTAIGSMIDADIKRYVDFFNKAGSITTRLHQLELLPGVGKKHMWKILEERRVKPFESFEDLKNRVDLLPDPKNAIIKRIIVELDESDKYNLFTAPILQVDNLGFRTKRF